MRWGGQFFNLLGELRDRSLVAHGYSVDWKLLQHLSPLGWDHIALTGDYSWKPHRSAQGGHFLALRPLTSG